MKLVTFLKDHAGYQKGASQYYAEPYAEELIKMGLVRDAYAEEPGPAGSEEINKEDVTMDKEEEEQKKKALDAPVKDKMLRMPRKKK